MPVEVCATVNAAVHQADLICTLTAADTPVLTSADVADGAHINVVGSSIAAAAEINNQLVKRARFFVDFRPSALQQAGEFLAAKAAGFVTDDHILAEIGQVLNKQYAGRQSADDVTIYKSLGIPAQDLTCANYIYQTAVERGPGGGVPF